MNGSAQKPIKYPSEEEYLVRRLGGAVLALWDTLAPDVRERIQAEANRVWDREYGVAQIDQKLSSFIRKYQQRLQASRPRSPR